MSNPITAPFQNTSLRSSLFISGVTAIPLVHSKICNKQINNIRKKQTNKQGIEPFPPPPRLSYKIIKPITSSKSSLIQFKLIPMRKQLIDKPISFRPSHSILITKIALNLKNKLYEDDGYRRILFKHNVVTSGVVHWVERLFRRSTSPAENRSSVSGDIWIYSINRHRNSKWVCRNTMCTTIKLAPHPALTRWFRFKSSQTGNTVA